MSKCKTCGDELMSDMTDTCYKCNQKYLEPKKETALRFNEGKTPYSHLPLDLLDGAARVMEYGSRKYSPGNYRKGYEDEHSPADSLVRHVASLLRAIEVEDKDGGKGFLIDESGFAHVHHVITSAMLLLHTMRLKGWKV